MRVSGAEWEAFILDELWAFVELAVFVPAAVPAFDFDPSHKINHLNIKIKITKYL